MRSILPLSLSLSSLPFLASATVGFGGEWWLNSWGVNSGVWVASSKTTLQVPAAPNPQTDRLAIWPGMETANKGLVQSIIVSFADPASNCGGQPGQWCVFASFNDGNTNAQTAGAYVPVSEGDMLDMDFNYDDSTGTTVQNVYRDGQLLSTFTSSSGRPYAWNIAVECQDNVSGNMPAHTYHNTQIMLGAADPDWGSTLSKTGTSDSGLLTPDGGLTWIVDTVNVDSYPCTPQ
ncbi:hypothetical protein CONPUDRAFT_114224 [Coniophora puteana RWD-64-598 SS2]|uniref:Concanavalin A-like lectin glucanase n=1 Tax=Coniophora puteana (strain RWD-64-598) TaxID=741705 RepID=A0A5M3N5G2_CONPW|nr:uncharacterized protein CONPUDRAFT_114224 [Coniophora puteana RWD-64-598 SS2]EIW86095.1 hypothetical protein CONPUDRAFT_114224 [Coniophora puteana RWD-64-598 SS2]